MNPGRILRLTLTWFIAFSAMALGGILLQESVELVLLLAAIMLILFPGKTSPKRLVRVMPWLWVLNFLSAVFILGMIHLMPDRVPSDLKTFSDLDLWGTLVLSPTLLTTYYRHPRYFKPVLISAAIFSCLSYTYGYSNSDRLLSDLFQLLAAVAFEMTIAFYLVFNYVKPTQTRKAG